MLRHGDGSLVLGFRISEALLELCHLLFVFCFFGLAGVGHLGLGFFEGTLDGGFFLGCVLHGFVVFAASPLLFPDLLLDSALFLPFFAFELEDGGSPPEFFDASEEVGFEDSGVAECLAVQIHDLEGITDFLFECAVVVVSEP